MKDYVILSYTAWSETDKLFKNLGKKNYFTRRYVIHSNYVTDEVYFREEETFSAKFLNYLSVFSPYSVT